MPAETTTVHAIGRCPTRGCPTRRRHTFNGTIKRDRLTTWTSWGVPTEHGETHPAPRIGGPNIPVSRLVAYLTLNAPEGARTRNWSDEHELCWVESMISLGWVCLDHDRFCKVNTVKGVINESKGCNARCEAATGPDCECSCGGQNHGAAYDLTAALF